MMRMKKPLFGTGKDLVMGGRFFVLKGIVSILTHGVYGTTVIKKKRYWSKYCKVDSIEALLRDKEVGYVSAFCSDLDTHKYKIKCIKEADCVMKIFITYGLLSQRCQEMSSTYKNKGETIPKDFVILNQ